MREKLRVRMREKRGVRSRVKDKMVKSGAILRRKSMLDKLIMIRDKRAFQRLTVTRDSYTLTLLHATL